MTTAESNSQGRTTLRIPGCTPTPLTGYLKALGVLRLVSAQCDARAEGFWKNDVFHLCSVLDRSQLCKFLLNDYQPTPIVAPWNGGSGFYPKDNRAALDSIMASGAERFSAYQDVISICRAVLSQLELSEKPDPETKTRLLQQCRNRFPDSALQWLDAAFVLTDDGPKYPPLLGTGGNDGRLEFTNNYMQRLTELFDSNSGTPMDQSVPLLDDCLFAACGQTRHKAAVGQFDPGSAGGANATTGYDADASMNLWDFVLTLEGAIAFAGASVRRLETGTTGSLAYPFCVRATGIGYGSASAVDESTARAEMWMPLWSQPSQFSAISHLLSEGRADIGRRRARSGVDFARAIAAVGVDRGITSFERFAFHKRNGLSYFAVPLGRFEVGTSSTNASLVSEIDTWLDRFRRVAIGSNGPATAARALRKLEAAIMTACQRDDRSSACDLLISLGQADRMLAGSPKLHDEIGPVPLLSARWLKQCYQEHAGNAVEIRLAGSLAALGWTGRKFDAAGPFRRHLAPLDLDRFQRHQLHWAKAAHDPATVWTSGDLCRNLNRLLTRRIIDATSAGQVQAPFTGKCAARLDDLTEFIDGQTDDRLIDDLAGGLMLLDWAKIAPQQLPWGGTRSLHAPPASYALLKLCLAGQGIPVGAVDVELKLNSEIARRSAAGGLEQATRLAARRLRASRLAPAVEFVGSANLKRNSRVAAALVFPVNRRALQQLATQVLRRDADSVSEPTVN